MATKTDCYLWWGEDDFALQQAVQELRDRSVDPLWASFNAEKITPDHPDGLSHALNQAMTPPFGAGKRFVWLADTSITQQCSEDSLSQLQRTISALPDTTVLLLTSRQKPDGRLKSTKLLQSHAQVQEFALIPPWKTELIQQKILQTAQRMGIQLTVDAVDVLVEAVGNDSRQLFLELKKLDCYAQGTPLNGPMVSRLVTTTTQNSLKLAEAIRNGDTGRSLGLIADLLAQNEHPLRILATLIGQFRTWLWVKLLAEAGEKDDAIAAAIELKNPKRVYFLRNEVKYLSVGQLSQTLPLLLELELSLKQGAEPLGVLQTKVVELCRTLARK